MATTAVLLFLFIVLHLFGNLKIFYGEAVFENYAVFLREVGHPLFPRESLLWFFRAILIVSVLWHIFAYIQLWVQDRRARRVGYRRYDPQVFSMLSRAMIWGGIAIGLFVIWHLLDLTTGTVNPSFDPSNPYHNVVASFHRWPVAGFYILAVVALGMHLYHGIWSFFQTVGLNNETYNRYRRPFSAVVAILITIGYASIPIAVLTGVLR